MSNGNFEPREPTARELLVSTALVTGMIVSAITTIWLVSSSWPQ